MIFSLYACGQLITRRDNYWDLLNAALRLGMARLKHYKKGNREWSDPVLNTDCEITCVGMR